MKKRAPLLIVALLAAISVGLLACSSSDNNNSDKTPSATSSGTPNGTETSGSDPGVTSSEVILGTHTSLTGPISAYNIIPQYAKAYFDNINTTDGGVNGRKITYLEEDDQYSPTQAVNLTRKLVEQDHIFAMFNALGTPNHLAVVDYLQQNKVPDMFVATGAAEWVKDPVKRPLVFGSNPNYVAEGVVLGKWIHDTMGADKKVGVIYQNDDFGQDGLAGVKIAMGDNVIASEPYEVTDPDLNSQIDQLHSANVDVVVMFATPVLLATGVKHARADVNWNVQFAISAVSMNELTGVIAGADNIEGTVGPVATYMAYQTSIPGVQKHIDILGSSGIGANKASVLSLYGQYVSELMVEALNKAGTNLTRDSLVKGAESIKDFKCSVCLFPATLSATDHDPGQAVAIGMYKKGQIVITGPAYSWEGVSIADLKLDALKEIDLPDGATQGPP